MSEMMNWTTFTIVNMVRITGVKISQNPESAKTNRNYERFENTVNLILHSERNGRNDDLNKVHNNWNGAHQRSWNFVKAKMCKKNRNLEKFQNAVSLIYPVCAMSEMMI